MFDIKIPSPFLVTIDDVGWWSGRDGSAEHQPFRTGIEREHVPEDYRALGELGKALNMKIPTGFVLCEWDGTNMLKQLPSATWMGKQWQVPFTNAAYKEQAVSIINNAAQYIEPALHGVGHEFWIKGRMNRSEFHTSSGRMRHVDEVKKHLDYFFRLMVKNHFDPEIRLFIPPALYHSFGFGKNGFQDIISSFGIQFVTLLFERTKCRVIPQFDKVGWECGVVLIDRGEAPVAWNHVAPDPEFNETQTILPLHWANILHKDPQNNLDVVDSWVKAIDNRVKENNLLIARDLVQYLTQFLNSTRSKIRKEGNIVIADLGWLKQVPEPLLGDSVFFSVGTTSKITILGTDEQPASSSEEAKFMKLRLPKSGKIVFKFTQHD